VSELHVEALGPGRYRVTGGDAPHVVELGDGTGARCDCPDFHFRGHTRDCKHLAAVTQELLLAPTTPTDPWEDSGDAVAESPPVDISQPVQASGETAPPRARVWSLAELLENPAALQPPTAIVPRVAFRGRVSLVVGREKLGGKSTLLTAGAAAVSSGRAFLGEACAAGDVLWVSADQEHATEIVQRAQRFHADAARFHVLWPREPFEDLMAALEHVRAVLLVVDTLASFARTVVSDPHASGEWPKVLMPLLRVARDLETAVAISHHAKKNDGGGYRDSSAIGALVDLLLDLTPDPSNAQRRNVAALGRWPAENFTVELVDDSYQLVAGAPSLDARVLAFITANPQCSLRAVRAVGGRHHEVDQALARLLGSGAVRNAGTERRHAYVVPSRATATSQGAQEPPSELPF
jgi:AAA domain-containing protein/SWIM zinc finger